MRKYLFLFSLSLFVIQINAQDLTQNYRKIILNSPNDVSLFQSNSTNGIWASGMIASDRWGVFEDATTSKERLTILSGGNVGIGTITPSRKLHIYNGDSGITGYPLATGIDIEGNGAHTGINILSSNNGAGRIYFGAPTSYTTGSIEYNHNSVVNSGRMLFRSGNSERMTILGTGNVGIGTTSPENKFHVKADALGEVINNQSILTTIEGSVVGNNSKFQILNKRNDNGSNWSNTSLRLQRAIDGTPQAFIDFGIDGENSNYGLAFGTRNGFNGTQQTRMVIEENGNIGIGTTDTQGFKLGVNGKIAATEVKVATYANWPDYVFNKSYNLPTLKEVEHHIKEKGHLQNIPSAEEVKANGFFLGDMNSKLLQK